MEIGGDYEDRWTRVRVGDLDSGEEDRGGVVLHCRRDTDNWAF